MSTIWTAQKLDKLKEYVFADFNKQVCSFVVKAPDAPLDEWIRLCLFFFIIFTSQMLCVTVVKW